MSSGLVESTHQSYPEANNPFGVLPHVSLAAICYGLFVLSEANATSESPITPTTICDKIVVDALTALNPTDRAALHTNVIDVIGLLELDVTKIPEAVHCWPKIDPLQGHVRYGDNHFRKTTHRTKSARKVRKHW